MCGLDSQSTRYVQSERKRGRKVDGLMQGRASKEVQDKLGEKVDAPMQ